MRGLILILLLAAVLWLTAAGKMGLLAGTLFFLCAVCCGILCFLSFCAVAASLEAEDEDAEHTEEWT